MNTEPTRWSRAGEWYAAGLFLVYATLILSHAGAPSLTDYANWTYQGVLLRDHLQGQPDAAHVLKHYPVPNSAVTLGIGLLALVMPWMMAAKVYLSLQLAVGYGALRHLMKTVGGGGAAWVVVPQAVFLNVNFWYGFTNFELGVCWVMLMASLLLRRVRGAGGTDWQIGGLLLVAFFTHMIPFCLCALLVVLYAVQTKRWRVLSQLGPVVSVGVWYVAGRYLMAGNADGQAGMAASVRDYSVAFWEFKGNSYLKSFGYVNPLGLDSLVFGRMGTGILVGITVLLAGVSGWAFIRQARMRLQAENETRFLWLSLLVLLPMFVLAPGTALGISDPGARILQTGLALALVLGFAGAAGWVGRVATACACALSVAGVWLFVCYGGDLGFSLHPGQDAATTLGRFANVPNDDQNFFYAALARGDTQLKVFPTGMFLNRSSR